MNCFLPPTYFINLFKKQQQSLGLKNSFNLLTSFLTTHPITQDDESTGQRLDTSHYSYLIQLIKPYNFTYLINYIILRIFSSIHQPLVSFCNRYVFLQQKADGFSFKLVALGRKLSLILSSQNNVRTWFIPTTGPCPQVLKTSRYMSRVTV